MDKVCFDLGLFFHNYTKNKLDCFKLVNMIDKSYDIDPTIFDTFVECLKELPTTSGCVTNLMHYYLYYHKAYYSTSKDRIIIYILPKQIKTDLQKHARIDLQINKIVNIENADILDKVLDFLNKNISENFNAIELSVTDNPFILLWDYNGYENMEDDIPNNAFNEDEEVTELDTTIYTEDDKLSKEFINLEDAIEYFKNMSSKRSFQLCEWLTTLKEIKNIMAQR